MYNMLLLLFDPFRRWKDKLSNRRLIAIRKPTTLRYSQFFIMPEVVKLFHHLGCRSGMVNPSRQIFFSTVPTMIYSLPITTGSDCSKKSSRDVQRNLYGKSMYRTVYNNGRYSEESLKEGSTNTNKGNFRLPCWIATVGTAREL